MPVMVKLLVLQQLYNLSDDALEYQVLDRRSFLRFLDLEHSPRVPDAKTIWVWRERLKTHDLMGDISAVVSGQPDPYGPRLQMLLLVSTLASFVSWLAGMGCEATGIAHWLSPMRSTRKLNHLARGPRSIGRAMADRIRVQLARSHPITASDSPRPDDTGRMKACGNLDPG